MNSLPNESDTEISLHEHSEPEQKQKASATERGIVAAVFLFYTSTIAFYAYFLDKMSLINLPVTITFGVIFYLFAILSILSYIQVVRQNPGYVNKEIVRFPSPRLS